MRNAVLCVALGSLVAVGCSENAPTLPSNRGPVTPVILVDPPGVVVAGVTSVSLNASTTDPEGDPLTYTWTFADGTTTTGAVVSRVFQAGTFNVSVNVSDGKGGNAVASASVTARTIAGAWTDSDPFYGISFTQTGSACGGFVYAQGGWGEVGRIENCVLSQPRRIDFFRRTRYPGVFAQCQYTGTIDGTMNAISVRCSAENSFNLKRD